MKNIIAVTEANYRSVVLDPSHPVLVDFWAEWCGPCKMLAPLLAEIANEYAGRVTIAKVNVDENPALAKQHHIQSIPALLFFKDGLVMDQLVGVAGKKAIVNKLENLWHKRSGNPPATEIVTAE